MSVGIQELLTWLASLQRVYSENKQLLTELDSAIGDADHGINMDHGFTAVSAALTAKPAPDIRALLHTVATVLISNVGGASGPLYGTFFLRASAACAGKVDLDAAGVVSLFQAGVEGVRQRGRVQCGDKTMVDTLEPALAAMQNSLARNDSLAAILAAGATAAEAGMRSTIPMQARKGRASYLGPRSVGHQDPGATSSWLLIRAAASAWT
jgi:phosphoenolpyruvate---glycerone phosphotransferase subunit DhaL